MAAFRVGVTSIVTSQTSGGRGTGLAPAAAWRYHAVHEGDASGRHECNLTKSSTATRISSPERMRGRCDVLITMDHGIEFQQPIASFPFRDRHRPRCVQSHHAGPDPASRCPTMMAWTGSPRSAVIRRAIAWSRSSRCSISAPPSSRSAARYEGSSCSDDTVTRRTGV